MLQKTQMDRQKPILLHEKARWRHCCLKYGFFKNRTYQQLIAGLQSLYKPIGFDELLIPGRGKS
jgi:hypothetical protein